MIAVRIPRGGALRHPEEPGITAVKRLEALGLATARPRTDGRWFTTLARDPIGLSQADCPAAVGLSPTVACFRRTTRKTATSPRLTISQTRTGCRSWKRG